MRSYFKSGSWNAVCDVCGHWFKSDDLMKRWDGLMVCEKDYEGRHPQSLIKIPTDNPTVPWSRPKDDTSGMLVCTYITIQAKADIGTANCAQVGYSAF